MLCLQFFYSLLYLPNLICFCLTIIVLYIYSWVTLPGCFIYDMATLLSTFSKITFTDLAEVTKSNIFRIL